MRDNSDLASSDIAEAIAVSNNSGLQLDRTLLKLGLIDETELLDLIAEWQGLKRLSNLQIDELDNTLIKKLGINFYRQRNIVPILSDGPETLIASSDPLNAATTDELRFFLGHKVMFTVATSAQISAGIEGYVDAQTNDPTTLQLRNYALDIPQQSGPAVSFIDTILSQAVELRASDIHFEMRENGMQVRLRKNGVLQALPIDRSIEPAAITARVKVISGLNTSEKQLPQDGRIQQVINGRQVDFRVSTLPASYGESIVCRILDRKAVPLKLDELGFEVGTLASIRECLGQKGGLFAVSGSTGSGKTTTLYAALAELNDPKTKIISIEDPIEYDLGGIEQVQVNEVSGLTFAKGLRAILRQDPNIVMIGEIRDEETAQIACRAALVGRLVLTTLHTKSPEQVRVRLIDLGVEPYLVDEVLIGALGQELKLVPCDNCAGVGCETCHGLGYSRRFLSASLVD